MRNKFGYVAFCFLLLSHPGYGEGMDAILSARRKSQPATNRIRFFEQIVDNIIIDISQAVPFDLTMNEAMTNAIKYAFGPLGGEVIIAFNWIGNDNLILMVADNGKGISEEDLAKETKSLGMKIMQILSRQLNAAYKLESKSGVTITPEFLEEKLEHNSVNNYINKK